MPGCDCSLISISLNIIIIIVIIIIIIIIKFINFINNNIIFLIQTPEAYVETMLLDLASFASIKSFAEEYRRRKL